MSRDRMWVVGATALLVGLGAGDVDGQWVQTGTDWCEDWGGRDQDRHCLTLEADFADAGRLVLDGGLNGGVHVEGWNRDRIEVRAKVWANASSEERAVALAEAVEVEMRNGRLSADGPRTERRENWGVSWEVMVPENTDLDIETKNGGIAISDVRGRIDFSALNGGVDLSRVGGDVTGRTTNGGLDIELDGRRWSGQGLDVETTNGGVTLRVPEGYSAELETGTVNGGFDLDFPITVQGRLGRRLATTLGEGGPQIRALTTNGGVRIVRSGSAVR